MDSPQESRDLWWEGERDAGRSWKTLMPIVSAATFECCALPLTLKLCLVSIMDHLVEAIPSLYMIPALNRSKGWSDPPTLKPTRWPIFTPSKQSARFRPIPAVRHVSDRNPIRLISFVNGRYLTKENRTSLCEGLMGLQAADTGRCLRGPCRHVQGGEGEPDFRLPAMSLFPPSRREFTA